MSKYLDKFRTTMPASQARHVLDFLTQLKDTGAVRTVQESEDRYQRTVGGR